MPTARELLDQADALMRRNRPAAPPPGEDGIPTLMDVVPALPVATEPTPVPAAPARDPVSELADVPLLTDAVEEIEAPSILDEPPEEDDPQAWTDTLTGAHTIIPALAIDLPAPVAHGAPAEHDVGVLPEEWSAATSSSPGQSLAVETIDIPAPLDAPDEPASDEARMSGTFAAAQPIEPVAEPADLERHSTDVHAQFASSAAEPADLERDATGVHAGFVTPPSTTTGGAQPSTQSHASFESAHAQPDAGYSHSEEQPPTPFEWPAFGGEAPAARPGETPTTGAAPSPAAVAHPPAAGEGGTAPAPPDDDARWHALAEEIRMQVLQRIDLFTDTGLREQLAARLQPIVDRAGADLVATINQHVGVLLRAYVAEAIEREIERWRADGR